MQTQNKGITTVGELGQTLAQVTPVAAAMGVEFEYVGDGAGDHDRAGHADRAGNTQLKTLFAELGKNGTIAAKALEKAVKAPNTPACRSRT
jgi:hypothetical protein